MKLRALFLFGIGLVGCVQTESPNFTKEEARLVQKADGFDFCEFAGWYGDGICDDFCKKPDSDCEGPDIVPAQCLYDGKTYFVGDNFPSSDSCNTCTCVGAGQVSCTEINCPNPTCLPFVCPFHLPACDKYKKDAHGCETCECETPAKTCVTAGCSGQLCVDSTSGGLTTTCEWLEEYACFDTAKCEVQSDGNCGWTMDANLQWCLSHS